MKQEDKKKFLIVANILFALAAVFGGYWYGFKSSFPAADKQTQAVEEKTVEKKPVAKEPVTQKESVQETTPSPSSEISYRQYVNGRFHYSLDYPDYFIKTMVPANGDGVEMRSPNDYAELNISGSRVFETIAEEYQRELNGIKGSLGYHTQGSNWYVITWIQNGNLCYQKTLYKNDTRASFRLKYPEEMKEKYTPILEHMEATMRID